METVRGGMEKRRTGGRFGSIDFSHPYSSVFSFFSKNFAHSSDHRTGSWRESAAFRCNAHLQNTTINSEMRDHRKLESQLLENTTRFGSKLSTRRQAGCIAASLCPSTGYEKFCLQSTVAKLYVQVKEKKDTIWRTLSGAYIATPPNLASRADAVVRTQTEIFQNKERSRWFRCSNKISKIQSTVKFDVFMVENLFRTRNINRSHLNLCPSAPLKTRSHTKKNLQATVTHSRPLPKN